MSKWQLTAQSPTGLKWFAAVALARLSLVAIRRYGYLDTDGCGLVEVMTVSSIEACNCWSARLQCGMKRGVVM